jgi:type I restriction enzyme S subunit
MGGRIVEDFKELNSAPAAWLLSDVTLTTERMDAAYYEPRYLRAAKKLGSLPFTIRELRRISSKVNCGATPKLVKYGDSGLPLIRTSNVRPNMYDPSDTLRVPGKRIDPNSNLAILPGDVLYTMSGSIGYTAVYPKNLELASCSNTIARARIDAESQADPYYVALFLNSGLGMSQSSRLVSGGVLAHVMPNSVKRLRVALPSPQIQRAIGNKLRKAEQLRETTERWWQSARQSLEKSLLLALSTETFESFVPTAINSSNYHCVNVDPAICWTKANSAFGAQYYHPRRIHAQQLIVRSGPWTKLNEVAVRTRERKASQGNNLGQIIGLDQIDSRLGIIGEVGSQNWEEGGPWISFRPKSILFSRLRPYLNKVAIWPDSRGVGFGSGELIVYESNGGLDPDYLFFILKSPLGLYQVLDTTAGSTLPRVEAEIVDEIVIPRLDPKIEQQIGQCVRDAHEAWYAASALIPAAKADVEALIDGTLTESALLAEGEEIEHWLKENPSPYSKERRA